MRIIPDQAMSNERDALAAVIENAYDLNEGMVTFDLLAHAVLSAGYGKSSDRRPSVVTDAANRVAYFLNWHQGDNDIAADFPSGPSLYASDLQVILNELKAGSAK